MSVLTMILSVGICQEDNTNLLPAPNIPSKDFPKGLPIRALRLECQMRKSTRAEIQEKVEGTPGYPCLPAIETKTQWLPMSSTSLISSSGIRPTLR